MRKAVAVALMFMTSSSFANDDAIEVPKMTMIPFSLSSPADDSDGAIGGYIRPIKSKDQQGSTITRVTTRPVDQLVARECALDFERDRQVSAGPVNAKGGVAHIKCPLSNGRLFVAEVLGSINDVNGNEGLSSLKYGDAGYFLVSEPFTVPPSNYSAN